MSFQLDTIKDCTKCPIRSKCNQVVVGIGSTTARLFFVGEGSSPEDDLMGEPFSGLPGQLLYKLLDKAGLNKDEIYFTNLVKCTTPALTKLVIQTCKGWLWKELQVIQPKAVVTLGKLPTQTLLKLKSNFKLSDVVGQTHKVEYMGAIIVPWYNPNYLLNRGAGLEKETIGVFNKLKELV